MPSLLVRPILRLLQLRIFSELHPQFETIHRQDVPKVQRDQIRRYKIKRIARVLPPPPTHRNHVPSAIQEHRLKAGARPDLLNPVFGLPQAKSVARGPEPSANERYWLDWFEEFTEIDSSMNRLDQALVYLSHFPGSRTFRFHRLSEAWLRYHIEAYLQETYILFQRLSRFLRRVQKVAIDARDKGGVSSAKKLKTSLEASFKSVVGIRGRHVHEYRFQDDELRNLDTLL
jgi:hypothetical protein